MMGAQWWGTGFDPDGGGLWTGEVILHWISSRGTHDLKQIQQQRISSAFT